MSTTAALPTHVQAEHSNPVQAARLRNQLMFELAAADASLKTLS
jgi:hypothetical protein